MHQPHQPTPLDSIEIGLVDRQRGGVAVDHRLCQAALLVATEQLDPADLFQVHAHRIARTDHRVVALDRPGGTTAAPPGQQTLGIATSLGGSVGPDGRRRRIDHVVDRLVDDDALRLERDGDRFDDLTAEFDLAQHVRDVVGVHHAIAPPTDEQRVPLCGIDPRERGPARDHVDSHVGHTRSSLRPASHPSNRVAASDAVAGSSSPSSASFASRWTFIASTSVMSIG